MGLHYLNKLIHPLETYMSLLIWQLIFFLNPVNKDHQKRFVSAGKASNTPSLSYLRGISTLQVYAIIYSLGNLITFLFYKTSYWPIMLMLLRRLDLMSKKQKLFDILISHLHVKSGRQIQQKSRDFPSQ